MLATRTITRFVIALCPASKVYLAAPSRAPKGAITRVKDDACRFDTFDAAMEVAKCITGWGGAQRVEEIAVEVVDTRVTLDTPEARIEVRDTATAAFDGSQASSLFDKGSAVVKAMFDLGLQSAATASVFDESSPDRARSISVYIADHLGNLLTLDWDHMRDGFSYETEGDDACDIGETEAQHEDEPDTVACDGCEATDAEPCGDEDGHAFCAACRAKSQAAPKAADPVTFDPAFLDAVLGRDDLTFDQTPLTAEQQQRARANLTHALRILVLENLFRLASSALVEARENA